MLHLGGAIFAGSTACSATIALLGCHTCLATWKDWQTSCCLFKAACLYTAGDKFVTGGYQKMVEELAKGVDVRLNTKVGRQPPITVAAGVNDSLGNVFIGTVRRGLHVLIQWQLLTH